MPLLLVQKIGERPSLYRLTKAEISIGRSSEMDLVLPDDSVSRKHACLKKKGSGHFLEELKKNSGLLINKRETASVTLKNEDVVQIGKYNLIYLDEKVLSSDREMEVSILPAYTPKSPKGSDSATMKISSTERKKLLNSERLMNHALLTSNEVKQPDGSKERWKLSKKPFLIGPGGIAPAHAWYAFTPVASIEWDGRAHVLRKSGILAMLKFLGGVEINERAVEFRALRPGDRIKVLDATFTYSLDESGK